MCYNYEFYTNIFDSIILEISSGTVGGGIKKVLLFWEFKCWRGEFGFLGIFFVILSAIVREYLLKLLDMLIGSAILIPLYAMLDTETVSLVTVLVLMTLLILFQLAYLLTYYQQSNVDCTLFCLVFVHLKLDFETFILRMILKIHFA